MKKFCLTGLALTLILCTLMSTALAVDATILRLDTEAAEAEGYYPTLWETVAVGDTIYQAANLVDNTITLQILRWQPGMEQMETWLSGLVTIRYSDKMEYAKEAVEADGLDADVEHGVARLFTDGERLMAVNHLNGKIFAITEKDGKPVFEDIVTVKDTDEFYHQSEDYAYFRMSTALACAGDKLLWYYNDWDDQENKSLRVVLSIDLKDGSVKRSSLKNMQRMTAYKDGKVLALCRDEENAWDEERDAYRPMDIVVYDPATDKVEKVGSLDYPDWSPSFLAYSKEMDAMVYSQDTRVMAAFNGFKELRQVGYVPMSYYSSSALVGDTLVASGTSQDGVLARTLSKDFKADEYINVFDGYMDDAARAFAETYPQIPVYSVTSRNQDAVTIDLLMNAGADAPDIMQLNMSYSVYSRLAAKGYCADLSGYEKLAAYVNDLYPVYRDAVTGPNGEIFAIPMYAYSYDGFTVNRKVMEDMKLTIDDLPTNLVELCEFITRWNDEFVDEFSKYSVLPYMSNYKKGMFELIFTSYIAHFNATGEDIRFDTPVFREMIAALEAMECKELEDSLKTTNPEESDYRQSLFWSSGMLVGGWSDYTREDSERIFIPMGLTKDVGYHTGVEMQVMFLNPKSQHKEMAVKLMEYMIADPYERQAYTLFSTKTEPIENKYFDEWLTGNQEGLEQLEKSLAEAPENEKKEWQARVDEQKAYIERVSPAMQYTISPGAIKTYREIILPYVYVSTPSFTVSGDHNTTEEFDSLMRQYQDGKIDINRFIREADSKLMMMQQE